MSLNYLIEKTEKQLRLTPETIELSKHKLNGFLRDIKFENIYKEWLNERITGISHKDLKAELDYAISNPDKDFMNWLDIRIKDPFRIPFYTHLTVMKNASIDADLLFRFNRWKQELAWAYLMRRSPDNIICIMAGMIINIAMKSPSKLYKKLVEVYSDTGVLDNTYLSHPYHNYDVEMINSMDINEIDPNWTPLWLMMARKEFSSKMDSATADYLARTSQLIREKAEHDEKEVLLYNRAIFVTSGRNRLVLSKDILNLAFQNKMMSNDLLYAEYLMKNEIINGNTKPPLSILRNIIRKNKGKHVVYTKEETQFYSDKFFSILPNWLNSDNIVDWMDDEVFRDILTQELWMDDIRTRARSVPVDFVLDYALWFIEKLIKIKV